MQRARAGRENWHTGYMVFVAVFTLVMALLGCGIATGWVPIKFLTNLVNDLHCTIGITTPDPKQVRMAVLLWIISMVIIVDGMFILFRYVFVLRT